MSATPGALTRTAVTELIVASRLALGLSWQELADSIDKPVLWSTAALLGQHPLNRPDAETVTDLLSLPPESIPVLASVPTRGAGHEVAASDPTIYRFHEALAVYGPAIKEIIHEQFGDGIMSAINFSMSIERKPHPGGDRVVVTFDGKFLPYEWTSA
jgi:cyanate lyase